MQVSLDCLIKYFENLMDLKSWIEVLAITVGLLTFYLKFKKDAEAAAYREAIAYMDRHAKDLRDYWDLIKNNSADEKTIKLFLNRLEQMALLVNKKAFDNDLVYSSYWELYTEPLKHKAVLDFYENARQKDKEIFAEYKNLSEKWAPKIAAEQQGLAKSK
jgi:myosin-crossreactive antigen